MRASSRHLAALVVLAGAFALGAATVAQGKFTGGASAGSLQVSTAILTAPTAPSAGVWLCFANVAVTVAISWTDDDHSEDVQVLRASSPNGPFLPITDQQPFVGTYFDTIHAFSTTVYYAVRTTDGTWQSSLSGVKAVVLPSSRCR